MQIFSMILSLLCGVALFLFGMSLMGDGLKMVAGNKLEAFLYRMTNTPIKGVALGTAVTSVIQSSSATTVMVIGFVNSGMMKLKQAIGIIMGANIGTSITGWILCLSYIQGSGGIASIFSTATISAVVAVVGIIFRMFGKRSVHKNMGNIMLGFAVLMTGMQMMSGAVSPLRENQMFINMLTMFSNPLAGILVGILFTAVLHPKEFAHNRYWIFFPVTVDDGVFCLWPHFLSVDCRKSCSNFTSILSRLFSYLYSCSVFAGFLPRNFGAPLAAFLRCRFSRL